MPTRVIIAAMLHAAHVHACTEGEALIDTSSRSDKRHNRHSVHDC